MLTDEQIKYIAAVLDKSCINDACVTRASLYEAVKGDLGLKLEQYQFEQAITHALKTKRLKGFASKTGRYGGIGRASSIKRIKTKQKSCSITIHGKTYKTTFSERKLVKLVENVLKGKKAESGNVVINNKIFNVQHSVVSHEALKNLIEEFK